MTSDCMFGCVQPGFNGALASEPAPTLPDAAGGQRHFLCVLKFILALMALDVDHAEFVTEGRTRGKGRFHQRRGGWCCCWHPQHCMLQV